MNYYETLGVPTTASPEEIRQAYRKLSLKLHPDTNHGDPFFENHFKKIQEAYATLSDPELRAGYDGTCSDDDFVRRETNGATESGGAFAETKESIRPWLVDVSEFATESYSFWSTGRLSLPVCGSTIEYARKVSQEAFAKEMVAHNRQFFDKYQLPFFRGEAWIAGSTGEYSRLTNYRMILRSREGRFGVFPLRAIRNFRAITWFGQNVIHITEDSGTTFFRSPDNPTREVLYEVIRLGEWRKLPEAVTKYFGYTLPDIP